ncbi:hypothetical protein A2U01_0111282, partial [Trifolium medium]|nr:hypothetical protein [Trifolium medium]
VEEMRWLHLQIMRSWATRLEHLSIWAASPCEYPIHRALL